MIQKLILLVEDEPAIAEALSYALKREGWHVVWHGTATDALSALTQQSFDFIILDVGLPDLDGFELCRKIRERWQTPLLFLTARNDEVERIIGLEIGADDYCAKPFSNREIISRIKMIWRRMEQAVQQHLHHAQAVDVMVLPSLIPEDAIAWGAWRFDAQRMQAYYYDQALQLTRYELGLLTFLLRHPEQVFNRGQLMQQVWEYPDHSLERTVDSHIKTLRQKLKLIQPEQDPIITHRGLGYSLKR